jgi:ABC-type branched-subunit amino acid transport system ATPase component
MLSVDNVTVAYGPAVVLQDISLRVGPGEIVFIAGRNGAGKTTLLKTVSGFLKPREGTIAFQGRDVTGQRPERIARSGLRYVFQDKRVFSQLTVRENIELAAFGAGEKLPDAIARVVSLYPKIQQFLDVPAGGLSGGQRQILLIGRALVGNPKLLLIDEPTEGLAAGTINDILNVLNEMRRWVGMLIVEQNLSVVGMLANRLYIMQEGRIVREVTDPDEIRAKSALEKYL